ncbi:MAG: hypothetical protein HYY02_12185 [Chloroflexi bacterium]|nr:hypothetical protein [Chloroflexota bacterium]
MRPWSWAPLVATALFWFACAPQASPQEGQVPTQPKYGGTLNLAHNTDPPDLDALWAGGVANLVLIAPAYNSLVQVDPLDNARLVPDLAERWELSPDGKTYTFHLNKAAKWHDGKPVTAADIRYHFDVKVRPPKGLCCAEAKTPNKFLSETYEKAEVLDDTTVKVTLLRPSKTFLFDIGKGFYLVGPAHVGGEKMLMGNTVLGSGPFKFVSYTRGTNFKLTKNPDYFRPGFPYLDNIEIFILPDASTRLAAFRAGKIDVTGASFVAITYSQAKTIEQEMKDRAKVVYEDALENGSVRFNFARPPFNDQRVRKAVHLAVDRPRALKTLAENHGELGTNLPRVAGLTRFGKELETLPGYRMPKDQDLAEARRLLDEAGYRAGADGKRMTIRAITRGDVGFERYVDATVFFKDELAKIGIDATVEPLGTDVYTPRTRTNEWEAEIRFRVGRWVSPVSNQDYWVGVDPYGAYTRNPERDKAFNDYDSNLDPSKDKELVRKLEDVLETELIYSVWFWADYPTGIMNYVQNFKPAVGSYAANRWEHVWLSK